MSSCLNSMDYGTGINPSNAIPGGHNLTAGCPLTSTVWMSCQDSDCSPNGKCQGPPSFAGPTGCISNNSILNGTDLSSSSVGVLIQPQYMVWPVTIHPISTVGVKLWVQVIMI